MNCYLKHCSLLLLLLGVNMFSVQAQQKDAITFDIGSFAVSLLSEGQQQGKAGILINATEDMMQQVLPDGTFPNAVNAFLVVTGDKTVLFDTGFGRKLFDNLNHCGKTPADIDVVILTHMHGDHIGGLLCDGETCFPSAILYIPQPEYDYWMSDEEMNKLEENRRSSFINARKVIVAYKDRLQLFTPGEIEQSQELLPGIRSVAAYGHTPGHTGYMLESDGSKLFIWGDLTHAITIQMPYPKVAVTYDVNPDMAVESRLKLLRYISENNISVAGMHIPFPGIGSVKKNNADGYRFELICDCEGR